MKSPAIRNQKKILESNGSGGEVFTLEDAKILRDFADKTGWVCSLHYWSINGDSGRSRRRRPANAAISTNTTVTASMTNSTPTPAGPLRQPWAFANQFKSFTTGR